MMIQNHETTRRYVRFVALLLAPLPLVSLWLDPKNILRNASYLVLFAGVCWLRNRLKEPHLEFTGDVLKLHYANGRQQELPYQQACLAVKKKRKKEVFIVDIRAQMPVENPDAMEKPMFHRVICDDVKQLFQLLCLLSAGDRTIATRTTGINYPTFEPGVLDSVAAELKKTHTTTENA